MAKSLFIRREKEQIGEFVRDLRQQSGLTQADLAEHMGTNPPDISRIENGKARISPEKALRAIVSVATIANIRGVEALVSGIPALDKEIKVDGLIAQARREGKLTAHGTTQWIADMSGMASYMVRERMSKFDVK